MSILLYQRSDKQGLHSIMAYYNYDLKCYLGFQAQIHNLPVYNLQQNPNQQYAVCSLKYHLRKYFDSPFQIFSANFEEQDFILHFPNQQNITLKKDKNGYIENENVWHSYKFPFPITDQNYQYYCDFILQIILNVTDLSYQQLLQFFQSDPFQHNKFQKSICISIDSLKETWFGYQTDPAHKLPIIVLPYLYKIPSNEKECETFIKLLYDDIQRQRIMNPSSLKLGILDNNNAPLYPITLFLSNGIEKKGLLDSLSLQYKEGQCSHPFTQPFITEFLNTELKSEWEHIIDVLLCQPFQNASDHYKQLRLRK